jgi:hypothetical protein
MHLWCQICGVLFFPRSPLGMGEIGTSLNFVKGMFFCLRQFGSYQQRFPFLNFLLTPSSLPTVSHPCTGPLGAHIYLIEALKLCPLSPNCNISLHVTIEIHFKPMYLNYLWIFFIIKEKPKRFWRVSFLGVSGIPTALSPLPEGLLRLTEWLSR